MIQAVIFDFDGVIVDSEPLHFQAFNEVTAALGARIDYARYLAHYVGFDDRDYFREFFIRECERKDLADDAGYLAGLIEQKADAFEAICRQGVQTINGAIGFIRQVAGRVPIAIASGATQRDIDLILAGLGVGDLFTAILTADDVAKSKPDPTVYRMAVERLAELNPELGLRPEYCVAIEDTAAGIEAARGAGLWTLGLTTTGEAELLSRAHRIVGDLSEVDFEQLDAWFG